MRILVVEDEKHLNRIISEAVEDATTHEGYRYVLGSVLNQVLLHQRRLSLWSARSTMS